MHSVPNTDRHVSGVLAVHHLIRRSRCHAALLVAMSVAPVAARAQHASRTNLQRAPHIDLAITPPPLADFSATAMEMRDSIVTMARRQLGTRYVLGGESPTRGFDCSGLIHYIASALKLPLPRTAAQQAVEVGHAVPADTARLLPGDLVYFGRGTRASHIGIYVGNGRFIQASNKAGHVIETPLIRTPNRFIKPWRGARRIVVGDSANVAIVDPLAHGSTKTAP
jgi:cell wall-associated NlpC family hydrolase